MEENGNLDKGDGESDNEKWAHRDNKTFEIELETEDTEDQNREKI